MHDKVKISKRLLLSAISLLEDFEADDYSSDAAQLHGYVLHSLKKVKDDSDSRESFSKLAAYGRPCPRFEPLRCHGCGPSDEQPF